MEFSDNKRARLKILEGGTSFCLGGGSCLGLLKKGPPFSRRFQVLLKQRSDLDQGIHSSTRPLLTLVDKQVIHRSCNFAKFKTNCLSSEF